MLWVQSNLWLRQGEFMSPRVEGLDSRPFELPLLIAASRISPGMRQLTYFFCGALPFHLALRKPVSSSWVGQQGLVK